jgi:hypothetical protein
MGADKFLVSACLSDSFSQVRHYYQERPRVLQVGEPARWSQQTASVVVEHHM